MTDLVPGLEMITAFLLPPLLLIMLIVYCAKYIVRQEELDLSSQTARGKGRL